MTDAELVEAAALERQISELTRKNCELEEKLDEYENAYKFIMDDKCFNEEKHCGCAPILRAKVKELEAENAMLRKQVEQKLKIEQLDCLRRIRDAVGDNGKMMQDELVDHIAGLSKMVEEQKIYIRKADKLLAKADVIMSRFSKENALLRKRLEPIESTYAKFKDYPLSAISKRNAYSRAINQCMELKEGE
jgi:hypothetical protein